MSKDEKSNEWDSLWQEYTKSLENWKTLFEQVQAANPLSVYQSWNWDFITTERFTATIYRSLTE